MRLNILEIKPTIKCHNFICYLELLDKNYRPVGLTKFDEKYLPKILDYKWHLTYYGYVETKVKGVNFKLHNLVLPKKEGFVVDHIDHNTCNNLESNLRYATHRQNMRNRQNVKGIYKDRKNWRISLSIDGKSVHSKRYKLKEEAIKVRSNLVKKHFGEFACIDKGGGRCIALK